MSESTSSQVFLITGSSSGLGYHSALHLAHRNPPPSKIYLTARSLSRGNLARDQILQSLDPANNIDIQVLELDLASFTSVTTVADHILKNEQRLDLLMCNAGGVGLAGMTTPEGYEVHFGANYMGHALLIHLLIPLLLKTASLQSPISTTTTSTSSLTEVRIILLGSDLSSNTPLPISYSSLKPPTASTSLSLLQRYATSKLCCILLAKSLAIHHPDITSLAVHPGVVSTNLGSDVIKRYPLLKPLKSMMGWFVKGPEEGSKNQVWAATTSLESVKNGEYYYPVGVSGKGGKIARDGEMAEELWTWSQKELQSYLEEKK